MKYKLLVLLPILTLALSSCSKVNTKTTTFISPEFETTGNIMLISADKNVSDTLEFSYYKKKIENKFSQKGYSITQNPEEAKYIAFITYGIDDGQTQTSSTPIVGQTGGGTTYSSGSVSTSSGGYGSYSGSSYSMPTYGVVGTSTSSRTIYKRVIALDIVDAKSIATGNPKKVHELRATSKGKTGQINCVIDNMLESMFEYFPGKNGRTDSDNTSYSGC